jgi:hypothetical protein
MELFPDPTNDQVPQDADPDANTGDPLREPDVILAVQKSRMRDIVEDRWGNRALLLEDPSSPADDRSEDEDEDNALAVPESESESESGDEGESERRGDDEDDNDPFAESGMAGISASDILRERFECEVASIGSFSLS